MPEGIEVADFVTAAYVEIKIAANHSIDFDMEFLEEDETTPLPLTDLGTFKIIVSRLGVVIKTYTVGSGLAIGGSELNFLTLSRTVVLNTLKPGIYLAETRSDITGTGKSFYWTKGPLIVEAAN